VYSAAKASNEVIRNNTEATINNTPLVISPTKEEVNTERNMLKCKFSALKTTHESSEETIEPLCSKSLSLSIALKDENKSKRSQTAMGLLLVVTQDRQMNSLQLLKIGSDSLR
jgi:hypothetical protein